MQKGWFGHSSTVIGRTDRENVRRRRIPKKEQ